MKKTQNTLNILLVTTSATLHASNSDNLSERNQYDNFCTREYTTTHVELSCKTLTAPNYKEWKEVANKTRENVHNILTQYGHKLTCDLLLQLFGEIKNALEGMRDLHEKKYILEGCLAKIIGSNLAYDLIDELTNDECYRTLLGVVVESSDDDRDENGIPMAYARWTDSDEEESVDEEEKPSTDLLESSRIHAANIH